MADPASSVISGSLVSAQLFLADMMKEVTIIFTLIFVVVLFFFIFWYVFKRKPR